jgi:hypothetical protein
MPPPGRAPHGPRCALAGHARAPGGGRPSHGAPQDDIVAVRYDLGGAAVDLDAGGRRGPAREWRREAQRKAWLSPARGASAGDHLPELSLTPTITPSGLLHPDLPLPVRSTSSSTSM